ncbi:hypothetical protein [Gilvimarinus sp. DA14]|uniref:hypothetical protein n=1 Tax=Gilvimarinus sp. DA14 TaxID=2956798 RepID=UPI0020B6CA8F|nr:hypothetical protein [Gilvimarinus sp. DA14]UTF59325.1 hypothetical protein NHM04_12675 [Gilvimarinus sp. DA14]
MPRKTPLRQVLGFLAIALAIVALSVLATLQVLDVSVGEFALRAGSEEAGPYRHATMTDGQMACEEKAENSFDGRIRVLHVDTFSSRQDHSKDLYKIFLEALIYADSDQEGEPREIFISCFVHAKSGRIERFQFAGDSEGEVGPDGEEPTNYFGL